jgi:hypothetical protein
MLCCASSQGSLIPFGSINVVELNRCAVVPPRVESCSLRVASTHVALSAEKDVVSVNEAERRRFGEGRARTEQDHCRHVARDRGQARLKWRNRDLVLAPRAKLGREPVGSEGSCVFVAMTRCNESPF